MKQKNRDYRFHNSDKEERRKFTDIIFKNFKFIWDKESYKKISPKAIKIGICVVAAIVTLWAIIHFTPWFWLIAIPCVALVFYLIVEWPKEFFTGIAVIVILLTFEYWRSGF